MHTFQPYPIDMLELNPFTRIGKDWAVLTAGNKEKLNAMTVSWGGLGVLWGKKSDLSLSGIPAIPKNLSTMVIRFPLLSFQKIFTKLP